MVRLSECVVFVPWEDYHNRTTVGPWYGGRFYSGFYNGENYKCDYSTEPWYFVTFKIVYYYKYHIAKKSILKNCSPRRRNSCSLQCFLESLATTSLQPMQDLDPFSCFVGRKRVTDRLTETPYNRNIGRNKQHLNLMDSMRPKSREFLSNTALPR